MNGFVGQYEHQMDPKGRVSLPSAFRREADDDRFVLVQWQPEYLTLFPAAKWAAVQENLVSYRRRNPDSWNHVRRIVANAVEATPDKQGRILVPAVLQRGAGLEGAVLLIGNIDRVEIWDPTRYDEALGERSEDFDRFAGELFG